jgi:hypothetical protein
MVPGKMVAKMQNSRSGLIIIIAIDAGHIP